jgi:hypothetical protein
MKMTDFIALIGKLCGKGGGECLITPEHMSVPRVKCSILNMYVCIYVCMRPCVLSNIA